MHYSFTMSPGIAWSGFNVQGITVAVPFEARRAEADRRWPAVLCKLSSLRALGRKSVRIVDASCGAGELLMQAAMRARALGFVAIEGRGVDRDPAKIARAKAAARQAADPAIGVMFEVGDGRAALAEEAEFPADLVLYAGKSPDEAAEAAGETVLRSVSEPQRTLAA